MGRWPSLSSYSLGQYKKLGNTNINHIDQTSIFLFIYQYLFCPAGYITASNRSDDIFLGHPMCAKNKNIKDFWFHLTHENRRRQPCQKTNKYANLCAFNSLSKIAHGPIRFTLFNMKKKNKINKNKRELKSEICVVSKWVVDITIS